MDSLAQMIGAVIDQNKRIERKVDSFDNKIGRNAAQIAGLGRRLDLSEAKMTENIDKALDGRLEQFVDRLQALEGSSLPRPSTSKKSREEEAFWLARRSLRFSPIRGEDLRSEVADYVASTLDTDNEIVLALPKSAFRRAPANRNARIKDEVVVTFSTYQDRDFYKSMAFRLAGKKDFSIRLELPNHLLGQHRVLSQAGQELRTSNKGCRTNVRFEEESLGLVLYYRTQNSDTWKRVTPERAAAVVGKAVNRSIEEASEEDLRQLLGPATGANKTALGQ
jgi:hypothetical protein